MKVVFDLNDLVGGQYVELYAGGASIAFHLLFSGCASHVHINDLSQSVHAFWRSVLQDTERLCRRISNTPVTIDEWHRQKSIQSNANQHSSLELGFSTLFLNRTNRSGILTGGVVGGQKQNGDWSMDARYNKSSIISRIEKIAQHKKQITLYNEDAVELIQQLVPSLPEKSLVYLDPPYHSKGRRLYKDDYDHSDHAAVAAAVLPMKRRWVVSYDNVPKIRALYKGIRSLSYRLSYSANARYRGSEVIFFSDALLVPPVKDPVRMDVVRRTTMPINTRA